ncbi:MAG: hypothetical protein ACE5HL_02535 [Terriglobia bacterium]
MTIFYSKKFWVSLVGLIFAVLTAYGLTVPPEVRVKTLEVIMAIVAAYNVGQGIADGVSKGETSGVAAALKARKP